MTKGMLRPVPGIVKMLTETGWRVSFIIGAMFAASATFAQEAVRVPKPTAPELTEAAETERVVVTGSHIPIPTAESEGPLPVTNYTQEQLIRFGANTPAEGLRQLPSFVGSTENENNSALGTGSAHVNLRAFGSDNTLTMINGRRAFSFEDINALPLGFIESVEILKDGASATYGADAVAGVVNFKIRHALKGGEIDLLYGNTNLGVANDAAVRTGYLLGGLAAEKYNLTAGASYYDRGAIFARDTFLSSLADRRRLGGSNAGSPQFPGRILQNISVANTGAMPSRPAGTFSNASRELVLIDPANTPDTISDYRRYIQDKDGFSFREYTPAIPEQERYGFFVGSECKVLPHNQLTLFATAIYSNTKQFNGLTPSLFTLAGDVARSSPYSPVATIPQIDPATGLQAIDPVTRAPVFSQRLNSVSYASIEAGARERIFDSEFIHLIAGLKGEFAKDYFWEIGYVFDENEVVRTDTGDQRFSVLAPAVANGSFNPFVGLTAPRQGKLNGFTYDNAAALRAAGYKAVSKTATQDQLLDGKIGGRFLTDLRQGGMNFVVGFDLRRQDLSKKGDPILVADDALGFDADTKFNAEQEVAAAYVELNIPFVTSTMNVPFVHNFDFTFAWRYEHFEMSGIDPVDEVTQSKQILETDVPKFAVRWAPVRDLILRASYSRSFRTPTLFEFFEPRTENTTLFPTIFDPGAPGGPAFVRPPRGIQVGGSVDLQPERTDNYSAGFVLTPRLIPDLTITADYYQLNSEGVIVTGFAQAAVVRNIANPANFADRIIRDASGALQTVLDFPFNSARKAVEGIDITAIYQFPTENFGKFTLAAAYNHLFRFNTQIIAESGFTNYLGRFQSATSPISPGSLPYNKAYVQTQWDYKGFQLINTFNYVGDYKDFGGLVHNSFLVVDQFGRAPDAVNVEFTRNRDVKAFLTFDTQFSYTYTAPRSEAGATASTPSLRRWQQWFDQTTIRIGMNNIFDEPPPFNAGAPAGDNYDTSLGSLRGRYYYVGLTKKF
jgi:iron complex outermembrane receptor protein